MDAVELTYPPIDSTPQITPVKPPPGSPNDPARAGAPMEEAAEAPARPKVAGPAVAVLDFVAGREHTVTLRWPFVLDGITHSEVRIRRLTTEQVRQVIGVGEQSVDLYSAYALMTGLPPQVLRGLDAEDGLEVTEVCSDFLPQLLRTAFGFA
ncbi:phage tail assembly protein [Ancylobacter sp. TS-1]|uniref:phage tail assembly protein n=1 Tax=Ancylobacter sp. TS-1 TaxID=1850374 RepID=UPI001265CEDF|nr:phage tail assembly protein [Ancylobacter sp. TS-1]QFR32371.1 hypothetical protein GBB76_04155 [Ancylobacter sp. TS-1]